MNQTKAFPLDSRDDVVVDEDKLLDIHPVWLQNSEFAVALQLLVCNGTPLSNHTFGGRIHLDNVRSLLWRPSAICEGPNVRGDAAAMKPVITHGSRR